MAVALAPAWGCANADQGITGGGRVVGETLTVASLMPLSGPQARAAADVVDGEKLALAQADGRAGRFGVNFVSIDDGTGAAPGRERAVAEATRRALTDSQVIAVIGPLDSRAAMVSLPLLNAAGLLQVSPSAGYRGLTDRSGTPGEPDRFLPSGTPTFARVSGDDRALAAAMARAAGAARRVAVKADRGRVFRALAEELRRAARDRGLRVTRDPARADVVFYAGADPDAAAAIAAGGARVVAAEDAARAAVSRPFGARIARRIRFVTRSAPAGSAFAAAFRERFGRPPTTWAALGHEAMRRVLETLRAAKGRARDRAHVVVRHLEASPPPPEFRVAPAGAASIAGDAP